MVFRATCVHIDYEYRFAEYVYEAGKERHSLVNSHQQSWWFT